MYKNNPNFIQCNRRTGCGFKGQITSLIAEKYGIPDNREGAIELGNKVCDIMGVAHMYSDNFSQTENDMKLKVSSTNLGIGESHGFSVPLA